MFQQIFFIETGSGNTTGVHRANTLMEDLGPKTYTEFLGHLLK